MMLKLLIASSTVFVAGLLYAPVVRRPAVARSASAAEHERGDNVAPPTTELGRVVASPRHEQETAAPAFAAKPALSVRIHGPRDGLRGDLLRFSIETEGEPDSILWSLDPPSHGFVVLGGNREAVFSNREPGEYEIYCSVGGDQSVAHAKFRFTIEPDPGPPVPERQEPQRGAASEAMMQTVPSTQPPPNAVSWPQGVKLLALRVTSPTRSAEGIILAGSFRLTANRIKTGTFAGADPWDEVQRQAREALGAAYGAWGQFFLELGGLVAGLRQQGLLAAPQSSILLLESAAEALGSL